MSEVRGREQIRGSIDPLDIFLQAHRYFLGQELIYSSCDGNPQKLKAHAVPAVTLGVLACELFLKCLICVETGSVPRGHDLKKLFDRLSERTKRRLCELWDSYARERKEQWDFIEGELRTLVARDLPSAISAGCNFFERIRYRYEAGADYLFYLDDLPHMLGLVALELRPEWRQINPNDQE